MSKLSELNIAINALNSLWPLLEDDEKNKVIEKRDVLNAKASELAHKTLLAGGPELDDAISQLKLVTQAAKDAKESVDDFANRIDKVADLSEKLTKAVIKVTSLIAVL